LERLGLGLMGAIAPFYRKETPAGGSSKGQNMDRRESARSLLQLAAGSTIASVDCCLDKYL
jgi:hypothetical protein